jgi:hypothetical protein
VILEEFKRLATWEERHRRLASRLILVLALTVVIDAIPLVFSPIGILAALASVTSDRPASQRTRPLR